jgi:hypothetical protein
MIHDLKDASTESAIHFWRQPRAIFLAKSDLVSDAS